MQYYKHMVIIRLLYLAASILFSSLALATTNSSLTESSGIVAKEPPVKIEVLKPGSAYFKSKGNYPEFLAKVLDNYLSWVPTAEVRLKLGDCDFRKWEASVKPKMNAMEYNVLGRYFQSYFDTCGKKLETGVTTFVDNAEKMLSMKYDPQNHPYLTKLLFHLPGDIKLKGLLAHKGDSKPRPLIIIRIGIFSGVEDFYADRAWPMMFFEQSPFNVLLVENMTSSEFVENNSRFSFGGYDEGLQNILVARALTDSQSEYASTISSIHLMGISLGGHGVLYASLLNGLNSPKNKSLMSSFLLMCPVVDLQKSMYGLTQMEHYSPFIDVWSRRRLSAIFSKDPNFKVDSYFSFLPSLTSKISSEFKGGLSYHSSIMLPKGQVDSKDFWKVNDFWPYYENIREPVLIFATLNDPAVNFANNSKAILEGKIGKNTRNLNVVEMKQGYHCTLPIAYDWNTQLDVYQAYFLKNSPEFKVKEKQVPVILGVSDKSLDINDLEIKVETINSESKFIEGQVMVSGTKKTIGKFIIPLKDLEFQKIQSPLTMSEQQMYTRWAHHNLILAISARNDLVIKWSEAL